MDVVGALSTKVNTVIDAIYMALTDLATKHSIPIFYADNPPSITDYPDTYFFVALNENAASRYAMCYNSFTVPFSIIMEANVSIPDTDKGRDIIREANLLFIQGFNGYNFEIRSNAVVPKAIKGGMRITANINFSFNINIA